MWCGISYHKNTKFLDTIGEGWLYPMHKKWITYVYLEPYTTIGKFEARIMKFIVTTHPPQFTHSTLSVKINCYFHSQ